MIDFTRRDYELMLESLINEQRTLRDTGEYLRRMSLHTGDQMVKISKRMNEIEDICRKIEITLLAM